MASLVEEEREFERRTARLAAEKKKKQVKRARAKAMKHVSGIPAKYFGVYHTEWNI